MKKYSLPTLLVFASAIAGGCLCPSHAAEVLENDRVRAEFDARGLTSIQDKASQQTVRLAQDAFAIHAGDIAVDGEFQTPAGVEPATATNRVYRYESGPWRVRVVYELQPGWRFISKQIFADTPGKREQRIHRVELLRGQFTTPIAEQQRIRDGTLLRFAGADGAPAGHSLFLIQQNPFLQLKRQEQRFSLAYTPDMLWKPGGEAFGSDRLCLGPCTPDGGSFPAGMLPEWKFPDDAQLARGPHIFGGEVDALVECVRAFLLYKPTKSTRINVGWCENDYQIDIATPEGRTEYQRIIDQAAAVGCRDILFAPANSEVSSLKENRDAWGWENLLWLTMGQKVRKGEWDPAKDRLPASVQELVDFAKAKDVRFLAYIYPSLPFMQNPEWTAWVPGGKPGGYLGADTGQRSFQDWLLDKLVALHDQTGVGGYSFDHWWIAYDETPSSKYAQWFGTRRILHELRRRAPDAIIDGRQQYHYFGVWTWLAGSYPHPLVSDEQPESFKAFPDLHWSRVSADRQRRSAYYYRMECFVPPEIMPGYMTHQTSRNDAKGQTMRTRFRPADWDLLGWKYSVISAVATAPFHHVVNFIPARDEREFKAFSAADQQWMRGWFDWTDQNLSILRNVKPIPSLGQPKAGGVDGWAAFEGRKGFVFLFNPNARPMEVTLRLGEIMGAAHEAGNRLLLRQLYPDAEKGKTQFEAGSPYFGGPFAETRILLPPTEALVLEVSPIAEELAAPLLLGAAGSARLAGDKLELMDVAGETGTAQKLYVCVPREAQVRSVTLNGLKKPVQRRGNVIEVDAQFAGAPFGRNQQVGHYEPAFTGGVFKAETTIPARVFNQLAARKRAWPVDYTEEERQAAWLNADRLLLFINVAELDEMEPRKTADGRDANPEYVSDQRPVTLKVDGQPVPVKPAYTAIVRNNPRNTFVGWFADVTFLKPDVAHTFEAELPKLKPGQFQGLFFDTVEAEFTKAIVP
jgi:hypothetical protein